MRRDHRPYYLKKLYIRLQALYVKHFLRPQFESLGRNFNFMQPWNVEVFGANVYLGDHISVMASADHQVRFSVWTDHPDPDGIFVGDACLISPGVRISAAKRITIGHSCMIASGAYITDSDWHGLYNRVATGTAAPVTLEENVWLGDNAIVCKGVTIGRNSIIGARSVVLHDIPPNVVAAGNPAKPIRELTDDEPIVTRLDWYADADTLNQGLELIDKSILAGNTLIGWLRYLFFPRKGD
ncbi:MAG: acyltransferase [Thermodesulfobacteriota bacterium]|nr:acyltransferase [Thermodesulfobacteriota bacterium]